ncbi:GPI ethanolamine phosphate transferase 2 [[Candida] anglica]|uniref:GPI ethanolamine phosphate transferase 2 n=1 Tax=[Candida] anglica TaxID=148631 RepID=A0ABP0ECX4_9ASCO
MRWSIYSVLVVAHVVGLLLFLRGFFPSKVVLSGYNDFHDGIKSPFATKAGTPQFKKIVLMVVDAMRADFVYSETYSDMSFVHQLISRGNAIPYTAFSNPPTVTLPRLKGITTGGTPSFLDAILNVADDKDSSQGLSSQDSWIRQFRYMDNGKKINFYGDDTWLKLFPKEEFFGTTEGTNSFFVSDFTEVDHNVTRHLDSELATHSWDGLILHYLGLDHIGHKGGPDSVFMKPKQREMDAIVERIYNSIDNDTLFVLMGDHGMNEVGNHGGSSEGETNAALVLISPKLQKLSQDKKYIAPTSNSDDYSYFNRVNQIDLVPTLASLLNFPIPKNNLGVIMREHLGLWDSITQQKQILLENCFQFKDLVETKYGIDLQQQMEHVDSDSQNIQQKWNRMFEVNDNEAIDAYFDFLHTAQELLATSATNYNYTDIWYGITILILSTVATISYLSWYFLFKTEANQFFLYSFLGFAIMYSANFLGSSFIEEEHQIWWFFMVMSLVGLFLYNHGNSKYIFLLTALSIRIIRAFANTGQKFRTPYTLSAYLLSTPDLLWVLNIITYGVFAMSIFIQGSFINCLSFSNMTLKERNSNDFGPLFTFIAVFVSVSLSFSFKLCQSYNDGNIIPRWLMPLVAWNCESFGIDITSADKKQFQAVLTQLSRLLSFSLAGLVSVRIVLGKLRRLNDGLYTDIVNILSVFLIHQTRVELIPVFLAFFVIRFSIARILKQNETRLRANIDQLLIIVTTFTLCLQNISFFSMGNTNSLATVDLSNAYNGIASYDVFLVGLLTFISSFAGPIFWSFTAIGWLLEHRTLSFDPNHLELIRVRSIRNQVLKVKSFISLTFYSVSALVLCGSCINLRFHLFIWTVFCPKLLFFASWALLVNILVDFLIAGLLLSVS